MADGVWRAGRNRGLTILNLAVIAALAIGLLLSPGSSAQTDCGTSSTPACRADASLRATPQVGAWPLAVTFDGSASTPSTGATIQSWSLTFGDGEIKTGTGTPPGSIAHTYARPGNYDALLTINDSRGGTDPEGGAQAVVQVFKRRTLVVADRAQIDRSNAASDTFRFSARLGQTEPANAPLAKKTVIFRLNNPQKRFLCQGNTDTTGLIRCSTTVPKNSLSLQPGWTASFAGDALFQPASTTGGPKKDDDGFPYWLIAVAVGVLTAGGALLVWRRRRQS